MLNINNFPNGKARGYRETKIIENVEFFREFAIKKENNKYCCYVFSIESKNIDSVDDYCDFEIVYLADNFKDAIFFIEKKGGVIDNFAPFKGGSPI